MIHITYILILINLNAAIMYSFIHQLKHRLTTFLSVCIQFQSTIALWQTPSPSLPASLSNVSLEILESFALTES